MGALQGTRDPFPYKIEKDRNQNGIKETVSFYQKSTGKIEKKVVDSDENGKIEKKIFFDEFKRVFKIERDKNEDGFFELKIFFEPGSKKVLRLEEDRNKDDKVDKVIFYSKKNKINEIKEDKNFDGSFEVLWQNPDQNGVFSVKKEDHNQNGYFESTTYFDLKKKRPLKTKQDLNEDGIIDVFLEYFYDQKELRYIKREDKNFDNFFEKTSYFKGRNKFPYEVKIDNDKDTFVDTIRHVNESDGSIKIQKEITKTGGVVSISYFKKKKKLPYLVERDTNEDKKMDLWTLFDAKGRISSQKIDTDFDGKVDRKKIFNTPSNKLSKLELDINQNETFENGRFIMMTGF